MIKKIELVNIQEMMPGELAKNGLDPYLTPHTRTNPRVIRLDVTTKLIKLLEGNIRTNLCDLRVGNGFLDMPKAQVTKK